MRLQFWLGWWRVGTKTWLKDFVVELMNKQMLYSFRRGSQGVYQLELLILFFLYFLFDFFFYFSLYLSMRGKMFTVYRIVAFCLSNIFTQNGLSTKKSFNFQYLWKCLLSLCYTLFLFTLENDYNYDDLGLVDKSIFLSALTTHWFVVAEPYDLFCCFLSSTHPSQFPPSQLLPHIIGYSLDESMLL